MLYLRGKGNTRFYNSSTGATTFQLSERAGCYGNINVLLDYENPFPETFSAGDTFYKLFYNCTNLISAPELPTKKLVSGCYNNMFSGTSIVYAPELPAMNLASSCYYQMFYRCKSLKVATELPATILYGSCYSRMFYECSALEQPPSKLPATEARAECYYYMFVFCNSLKRMPKIYLTTLADGCMYGMFFHCRTLPISTTKTGEYTIPWRFPAVGLIDESYSSTSN